MSGEGGSHVGEWEDPCGCWMKRDPDGGWTRNFCLRHAFN